MYYEAASELHIARKKQVASELHAAFKASLSELPEMFKIDLFKLFDS